jgi:NAD(P)-dependent dehydrogenase (short-subunit alcohol dehydrogenase family)
MTDRAGAYDFTDKGVIVTGGARGVGRGITDAFLAAGATVVICGRNEPDDLPSVGDNTARFVTADVRDPDQIAPVIAAAVDAAGRLDVLVNNAGGSPYADAATASPRFSTSIITLNLIAPLHLAQQANAVMQEQDEGGSIVNIGSVSGLRPSPGTAAYGAAKAGLLNLTQSLAVEWAPRVRVNCVTGGLIETEQAHLHYGDAEGVAKVAATVPMGRMATPSDIAEACLWLASPGASYVTGANITIHGGGEKPAYQEASNAH